MNGEELLRIVDAIHREKDIDKNILFESIETALSTAVRKRHGAADELVVRIDRFTGDIEAFFGDEPAEFGDLGRIAAQTAKQVIIQRIRDAEQDVILREYHHKVGSIVNGTVQRIEGGNIIVNLGKAEGLVPRSEKVRGENYNPGDRIKAVIIEVRRVGPKVRIVLSRAAPDLVGRLFELEVPEISDGVIEIKRIAREPGFRTKIAVSSYDSRVDCIGACVGIRGTRIKSITDELNGEKIDIIRWNESIEVLIMNALRPANIATIQLNEAAQEAIVIVPDDQLSLGIGRKGQNVRLASKLTEWDLKIMSQSQADEGEGLPAISEEDLTEDDKYLRAGAAALGITLPRSASAEASGEANVLSESSGGEGGEAEESPSPEEAATSESPEGAEASATEQAGSEEAGSEEAGSEEGESEESAPSASSTEDSPPQANESETGESEDSPPEGSPSDTGLNEESAASESAPEAAELASSGSPTDDASETTEDQTTGEG